MRKVLDNLVAAMSMLMRANPDWINQDDTNRRVWKLQVSPALQDCKQLRDSALTSAEMTEVVRALQVYRHIITDGKKMAEALGLTLPNWEVDHQVEIEVRTLDSLLDKMERQQTQAEILEAVHS